MPHQQTSDLQKTADQIMKCPTEVVGAVFETHHRYIEQKEGAKGVKAVE